MYKALTSAAVASAALAAALLAPAGASAAALKPGSYLLAGVQNICLQAGGTWYGENFPGWGGQYAVGSNGDTAIFGNYSSGAGNDSIVIKKSAGTWNEWLNDLSYTYFQPATLTRSSKKCTPPAVSNRVDHKNPSE